MFNRLKEKILKRKIETMPVELNQDEAYDLENYMIFSDEVDQTMQDIQDLESMEN